MAKSESQKKTTAQKQQSTRAYKVRVLLWKHFETWFIIYDIRGIRLFSRMHPLSLLSLSRRWVHTIDWITLNLLCESLRRSTASAREENKQKIYFISLFEIELLFFYEKTLDFLEKAKSDVPLSSSSSTELSQFSRQRISININYAYHNPSEKKAAKATKRRTTAEER